MMQPGLSVTVCTLMAGQARTFGPNGESSAIDKHPLLYPVRLESDGIVGDEQADRRFHGGVEKAIHHYPHEHYAQWAEILPHLDASRFRAGGFGENVTTSGLTEAQVCIGDVFSLGTAVLEVSQARQPCWKLNVRFGCPDMSRRVQDTGYTGWYYRVLQAGTVSGEDQLLLLERPCAAWPLKRLLHYVYQDPLNRKALAEIVRLDKLSSSWRRVAAQRLLSGQIESWSVRLDTPITQISS